MRNLLLLITLLYFAVFTVTAQDVQLPFQPKSGYNNIALKGKMLPFPFGNSGGFVVDGGFEIGFLNRHSVGVDGWFMGYSEVDDFIYDTLGNYHDAAKLRKVRQYASFLNYRFYLKAIEKRKNTLLPYISLYYRYGTLRDRYNKLYIQHYNYDEKYEKQYSGGLVFGTVIVAGKHFGVDLNLGYLYKQREITSWFTGEHYYSTCHQQRFQHGVRCGVNLYWWLGGRKN